MNDRAAVTTLTRFALRFAALAALTLAILASVSVSASRRPAPTVAYDAPAHVVPDTASVVNARRYPLR